MNTAIETILKEIEKKGSLHDSAIKEASARQEVLAKPTGALGTLEEISIKLAGITGEVKNDVTRQAVVIMLRKVLRQLRSRLRCRRRLTSLVILPE